MGTEGLVWNRPKGFETPDFGKATRTQRVNRSPANLGELAALAEPGELATAIASGVPRLGPLDLQKQTDSRELLNFNPAFGSRAIG
jgi:hypothetical protein